MTTTLKTEDSTTIQSQIDAKRVEIDKLRSDAKAMHELANEKEWHAGAMETEIVRLEGAKEYVVAKLLPIVEEPKLEEPNPEELGFGK